MTSTELSETMPEISMVVNHDKQEARLSHPNFKTSFFVYKPKDQTPFFKVGLENGNIPKELSGHYSTLQRGIEAATLYLKNSKETFSVRSDRLDKERKERHASKLNSENS